ncbi:MAG TPA: DUF3575 domain-containing protein [Polyangiaceae bacterium]
MRARFFFLLFVIAFAALSTPALAAGDAGDAGTDDASADDGGILETTTPDNFGCSAAPGPAPSSWLAFAPLLIIGAALLVSRRRRRLGSLLVLGTLLAPAVARAEPPPPDLVTVHEAAPPTRRFAISYDPLTLMLQRYGGNVEALLASHHVLGVSAYYAYAHTNEDTNNVFRGVGGELGYRWYAGDNGPRGFYVGPSLLLGRFEAVPARGDSVSYWNVGGAMDLGWQALVADRVLFGLGAGLQYSAPTVSLPAQEVTASVYANAGLRPRLSLAFGVAF